MTVAREPVIVLGAGLQGVCVALTLARLGHRVTLIDEAPDCMLRASLVSEGKIHLGHVYANDSTFETSRLMLRAALAFGPELDLLAGRPLPWHAVTSRAFQYVVAPASLVPVDRLAAHYARLDADYQERRRDGASYLGHVPDRLWTEPSRPHAEDSASASAIIGTPELAVDTAALRALLVPSIRSAENIETLYLHRVEDVIRTSSGFAAAGVTSGGLLWEREASIVVNCLWSDRLRIDAQLGLPPERPVVQRLKYRVLARLPAALRRLPSLTIVLGPYGDLVTFPGGEDAYLSWYPACLQGWSGAVQTPGEWSRAVLGTERRQVLDTIARETLSGLAAFVPGLEDADVRDVRAGIIVCWGETDIDDPGSRLHGRHAIGVNAHDGYFSIDTGKLTCAPLFARQLVHRMQGSSVEAM